jgi:hypothetical protein
VVDISLESNFLALFYAYLKPFLQSFRAWALITILSALFLISCLIYSCNRSKVINRISQPEKRVAVILEIPGLNDLQGNWRESVPHSNESKPLKEDVAIYQTLFSKRGPAGYAPAVKERRDASGNVLERRLEYSRKEEMERVQANEEQEIFYPKTGAFYPIKKSRYPEFYQKCDLDGDGVITLYELGEMQYEFNRITTKYPEGDVDSIVKEFVSTRSH